MDDSNNTSKLVPPELYEETYSKIGRLQTTLPEPALKVLAREVLQRLSNKAIDSAEREQAIVDLSEALIGADPNAALDLIDRFHRDGANIKSLHLDYLAPAAALLGDWWTQDRIQFSSVSVGTGRIYAIVRNLARRFPPDRVLNRRHALFASIPGDDHTLGVRMATELVRKEGWDVDLAITSTHDELLNQIAHSNHLIIGLSGGGDQSLPELARLVLAIQVSQPAAMLLISGSIVTEARDALELMHIDAIESDFDGALAALERFWLTFSENQT
jgi:methanogenic corrinoid protein MtbC1